MRISHRERLRSMWRCELQAQRPLLLPMRVTAPRPRGTSPAITVNRAPFSRLQVLLPGEMAVAGSSWAKTGTPTSQTAGGLLLTATVNAVDCRIQPDQHQRYSPHKHDGYETPVLAADTALTGGTGNFGVTLKTAGAVTIFASDVTHASILTGTNSALTLSPAPYARTQVLLPGESATPGPHGKDRNTHSSDGRRLVQHADGERSGQLLERRRHEHNGCHYEQRCQCRSAGKLSLGTGGIRTNFVFTFKTAGLQTITAHDGSDATRTNTSSAVTVNPGALAKLQLLAPGESAAPGTASGRPEYPQRRGAAAI